MVRRWTMAGLALALAGCTQPPPVAGLCERVKELRAGGVPEFSEESVAEVAALVDVAPPRVAAALSELVAFSDRLLAGAVPSASETKRAQTAGDEVREHVRRHC